VPVHSQPHARGPHPPPAQDRLPVRALHAAGALGRYFLGFTLAVLLGACAAPPVDRFLLESERVPVRLEGKGGPLSNAQSKAILEELKKRSPNSGFLESHVAIEEALAGTPLSLGNKVILLEDGPATYRSMLAAIDAAKHHIHMETYIFDADDTGKQFAVALLARRKAGVQVRLMYDAVGSIGTPADFFKDLEAGGVEVVAFNPPLKAVTEFNHRDHRKLLIVDGAIAFLGGINISGVYSRGSRGSASGTSGGSSTGDKFEERPWRDTQVRIEGPVVGDLQRAFLEQWETQKKEKPTDRAFFPTIQPQGKDIVRAIATSPLKEDLNASYITLISAIQSAENEINITNAYFVPHPQLRASLIDAAKRGVKVRLVLPSRSDHWLVFNAGRAYYEELLDAGVKIYERNNRLLHTKSASVDGVWCTVGSTNLDWRSLVYNSELNAVVLGPEFAGQLNALFEKDIALSKEITAQAWHNRPLADRARELAARAWARLL
jgi:cardiolipin synthase